jgi:isopenicillin N synthase-like dioxygenase
MPKLELVKDSGIKTVNMTGANWSELIVESFKKSGFAVITNHGIDMQKVNDLYDQWKVFFDSDKKYDKKTVDGVKGFFPFKSENAKGNPVKDLKEFYHAFYPFKNLPDGISEYLTFNVTEDLLGIARHILFILQPHIPKHLVDIQNEPLHKMARGSNSTLLRILHYPPVIEMEKGAVRAAAHEDINLITLLPSATQPGLEVLDLEGNWHKVECDPGSIVINVGDMLQEASGGLFKSTTHRVVNPSSENISRYSMPLFVHPKPNSVLSKKYTADQYLNERLKEIGLK